MKAAWKVITDVVLAVAQYFFNRPPKDNDPDVIKEPESEDFLNPAAFTRASIYLKENYLSYLRGTQYWAGGKVNGIRYNSYHICKTPSGEYVKVFVHYSSLGVKYCGKKVITQTQFNLKIGKLDTWCNAWAGVYSARYFEATGNGRRSRNIQFWKGKEVNANQLIVNFRTGFYNTKKARIQQVFTQEEAVRYAAKGGCSFMTWYRPGGTGHIGVFTGRKLKGGPEISQAGKNTGLSMTLVRGFGKKAIPLLQYWVIVKNLRGVRV